MIHSRRLSTRLPRLAFEGERVTPTQGEDYATRARFVPFLRSCSSRSSAFPADRFSDSILLSTEYEFKRHNRQADPRQGELHEQRHVFEQQRADRSATRELLRSTTRSHGSVPGRKLRFQPESAWHLLTPWRCFYVALIRTLLFKHFLECEPGCFSA